MVAQVLYLLIFIYCGAKVGAVNGVNGWRPVNKFKERELTCDSFIH